MAEQIKKEYGSSLRQHTREPWLECRFQGGWGANWILKKNLIDQRVADKKRKTSKKSVSAASASASTSSLPLPSASASAVANKNRRRVKTLRVQDTEPLPASASESNSPITLVCTNTVFKRISNVHPISRVFSRISTGSESDSDRFPFVVVARQFSTNKYPT